MAFNILNFKESGLTYGGARPSLFQVILSQKLDGAAAYDPNGLAQLPLLCRAASLPSMMVAPIRVPYFGRNIKVAGDRDFDDWTVTIFNDEDFALRDLFEGWSNDVNRLESNVRDPNFAEDRSYKSDFNVRQFDKEGNIIRSYKMIGAWPSRISPIDLDWGSQNQIEVFQIMFSYDYWLPDIQDADNMVSNYANLATDNGDNKNPNV